MVSKFQKLDRLNAKKHQRGMTLIESVVAIVVAALGILGVVGTQVRTLADTQTTVRRAQAVRLIEELSERMQINPSAQDVMETYKTGFADVPTKPTVDSTGASRSALATYDLAAWKENVRTTLPLGKAAIFVPAPEKGLAIGQGRQLGVVLAWRENEKDNSAAYKDQIDATKVRAADGSLSDGTGGEAACPAGHTCHLQFITLPSRCATYEPVAGTKSYFCVGA